ncbi:MAG: hypothetical protein WAN22_28750 [Solirubrobacteraceae bacterium]
MRKLTLVLLLAVMFGVADAVPVGAASPAQVAHANQQAAVTAAEQMLGELVLPAGATQVPTEPVGDAYQLAHPDELFFYAAEVERHEFWTTGASPSAVIASIDAHLPPGARSSGTGYAGNSLFESYTLPTAGVPALGPRSLDVEAVELTGGGAGVRADASVRYSAPRLPDQRIPSRARLLEITRAGMGESLPSLTVTNHSKVRRVAGIIDSLPFAALRGVAISCPLILPAPIVTFTFRAAPDGPVLATVSEPSDAPTDADPCFTATLRIRGHLEPALLDGGRLLRRAGAILGVKLSSRGSAPSVTR